MAFLKPCHYDPSDIVQVDDDVAGAIMLEQWPSFHSKHPELDPQVLKTSIICVVVSSHHSVSVAALSCILNPNLASSKIPLLLTDEERCSFPLSIPVTGGNQIRSIIMNPGGHFSP